MEAGFSFAEMFEHNLKDAPWLLLH